MRLTPVRLVVIGVLFTAGCRGIEPNPSPSTTSPSSITPTQLVVTVAPADLPAAGGTATIDVAVSRGGYVGAGGIHVTLSATNGAVAPETLVSDTSGHAKAEWTGTKSATILAVAGDLRGEAPVRVQSSAAPTPAPAPPTTPPPTPNPTPGPNPTPVPPTTPVPAPRPAGDLTLAISASPAAPNASTPVTLSAVLSSTTGATVPGIARYVWDVNGDRTPDHVGDLPNPVVSYTAGTYTVVLTVFTTDNREVTGTLPLIVAVTPTVTATLTSSPSNPNLATIVTFTAAHTTVGDTGAIASCEWDFDSNGTLDSTTTAAPCQSTMTAAYPTIGVKTARVRITTANGQTTTASTTVTVSDADLTVALVAGAGTVGTAIPMIATVMTTGTAPSALTYEWDYQNDGTIDEVVTGGSPMTVHQTYNTAGPKTVKVTVKAADGRTAVGSVTIPVI